MAEVTHLLGLPLKHRPEDVSPQGSGSGLDADKVDGKHASEIQSQPGPHKVGGLDAFDGNGDELSFRVEEVDSLPSAVAGRLVKLGDHLYVGV